MQYGGADDVHITYNLDPAAGQLVLTIRRQCSCIYHLAASTSLLSLPRHLRALTGHHALRSQTRMY